MCRVLDSLIYAFFGALFGPCLVSLGPYTPKLRAFMSLKVRSTRSPFSLVDHTRAPTDPINHFYKLPILYVRSMEALWETIHLETTRPYEGF